MVARSDDDPKEAPLTSAVVLALAVFGASAVEMVEALTLVVAAGATRSWRSALEGSALAVIVLATVVGAIGVPLVRVVPIATVRVVVGGLLLVLGLGWLRKAILRASGHKAPHDEDAVYEQTARELRAGTPFGHQRARDAMAFAVAFKGVFLEGLEVVLIVVSLGSSSHRLGLAAAAAGGALLVVGAVGALVARQLSEVPENAMKMAVGIMLSSFGVFWTGEGAGIAWPGSDLFLLGLIGLFALGALAGVMAMRRLVPVPLPALRVGADPGGPVR
jgi:uncharacterized membrane protein